MLDSVGIRLPKYKVRELGLSLETSGDITAGIIDKLLFVQVGGQSGALVWRAPVVSGVRVH